MGLKLHGEVSLDGSGFEAGLKQLEHAGVHSFEMMKEAAMQAFGVIAIEETVRKTAELGEHIIDMAKRIGVGTDALQEFAYAAGQTGMSMDSLAHFIEKLNEARIDPKKFAAFEKFGINQSDLQSLRVEDLIMKLGQAAQGKSPQELIGPLKEIGGRQAGEAIGMLRDNLEEARKAAHDFGQVLSKEDAIALKFYTDRLKELGQLLLVELAPVVVKVFNIVAKAVAGIAASVAWVASIIKFTSKSPYHGIQDVMNNTPGFGGYTRDQRSENPDEKKSALEEAKKAALEVFEKMGHFVIDEAKLKKMLEDLKNATDGKPNFEATEPAKKARERFTIYSDQLVAVGNFLGANRHLIGNVAEQQLQSTKAIEKNTAGILNYLNSTKNESMSSNDLSDFGSTLFSSS